MVKHLPANAGDVLDVGSIAGWGRSPGGGPGNPLQHSCLQDPTDRGAWRATVHGGAESQTWLKWCGTRTTSAQALTLHPPALMPLQHSAHSACSCVSSIRGVRYSNEKSQRIPNSHSASAIRDRRNSRLWCNFMSPMCLDGFYKWFCNWVTQMRKILTGALPFDQLCEWT